MEHALSVIVQPFIRKRIARELAVLFQQAVCKEKDVHIVANNRSEVYCGHLYEYVVSFPYDGHTYQFTVSDKHPFTPPKVTVNHKPLLFYHKVGNEVFRHSLQKYTGIRCACCETILCSNNWDPRYTLGDVVRDIQRFRDATRQIVTRVSIDVIKRKYLIDDVNIVEWLY